MLSYAEQSEARDRGLQRTRPPLCGSSMRTVRHCTACRTSNPRSPCRPQGLVGIASLNRVAWPTDGRKFAPPRRRRFIRVSFDVGKRIGPGPGPYGGLSSTLVLVGHCGLFWPQFWHLEGLFGSVRAVKGPLTEVHRDFGATALHVQLSRVGVPTPQVWGASTRCCN